jgi:polyhydroxyalkanoate synthesis regulator phasin
VKPQVRGDGSGGLNLLAAEFLWPPLFGLHADKEAFMALFDVVRNALLAGFGVQEKVREFVDELVKKGELSESQGAKLVKEWSEKFQKNTDEVSKSLNEMIAKTLSKMNLSTKEDIDKLHAKIDALAERVGKVEGGKG